MTETLPRTSTLRRRLTIACIALGVAIAILLGSIHYLASDLQDLLWVSLGGVLLAGLAGGAVGAGLARQITTPVQALAKKAEELNSCLFPALLEAIQTMAQGDLTASFSMEIQPIEVRRDDEIGALTGQFNQLAENLGEAGLVLGEMRRHLSGLIGQAAEAAGQVSQVSARITGSAGQASLRIEQIALRMDDLSASTGEQNASIRHSQASMDQLVRAIGEVAAGAQEQAQAVERVSAYTGQIAAAIREVVASTQAVTDGARQAAAIASQGEAMVQRTVQEMENLKQTVGASGEKVSAMGARSDQIGLIAETIKDIASQTNLLALNTYIETARVDSQSHELIESMLNRQMITQASLINHILEERLSEAAGEFPTGFWENLAAKARLDTICITDAAGVIVLCNEPALIGWKFSDDPKAQTYPFLALLKQRDGVVCQQAQQRGADNKVFKYVGVSRRDQPGIVQVGYQLESLAQFRLRVGGLAVVADEVRKLADRSGQATREIAALTRDIQSTVQEAVKAMQSGMHEVEAGVQRASETGSALQEILKAVEAVNLQARQASQAAGQVEQTTAGLVQEIDAVAAVIDQDSQTAHKMASDSAQVRQAVERIASASQESQAAVDEVTASTAEMAGLMVEFAGAARLMEEKVKALRQQLGGFRGEGPSTNKRRSRRHEYSNIDRLPGWYGGS